jgi:exodeoxyribonuclease X
MLIRCVDLETGGDAAEGHGVCEVGWCDVIVRPADRPAVGVPYSLLTYPGRPMSVEARAVHHITDEAAKLSGAAMEAGFAALLDARRADDQPGRPDYFAAHHADGDREFFKADVPWICTWKAALRIVPDAPGFGLQVLRYYLELPCDGVTASPAHRAGPDAYVLAHLTARLIEIGGAIEDMARWSTGPALLPRVTFGKHQGKKWEEVPTDYLDWIIEKSDMDRDVKANARFHLRKRAEASRPGPLNETREGRG